MTVTTTSTRRLGVSGARKLGTTATCSYEILTPTANAATVKGAVEAAPVETVTAEIQAKVTAVKGPSYPVTATEKSAVTEASVMTCASFACGPAPWEAKPDAGTTVCPPTGCTQELCCIEQTTVAPPMTTAAATTEAGTTAAGTTAAGTTAAGTTAAPTTAAGTTPAGTTAPPPATTPAGTTAAPPATTAVPGSTQLSAPAAAGQNTIQVAA